MPGHELANEMLKMARSDLKALTNMMDSDAFDDRVFGFHAQQAVEKAMKAWIILKGRKHPFTHDLSLLLHRLEELGEDIEKYWEFLDLTTYAVRFRYEAPLELEEPLDREQILKEARSLLERVENLRKQS